MDFTLLPMTAMGTIILSSLAISTGLDRSHPMLAIELAEISAAFTGAATATVLSI
jgi:hypothetical protein